MKYVCARCGRPCGWWAKGDGGYWKHQNGGWKPKPTCGQPAQPVRVTEVQFSPALRAALLDVRRRMAGGATLEQALQSVALGHKRFMEDELRKAHAVSVGG